ncbi:MAG: hypothetical protein KDB00_06970, partial [Planctomycetales bacterium]|nr:hypothetical protein [Planctomycetales bacterium]
RCYEGIPVKGWIRIFRWKFRSASQAAIRSCEEPADHSTKFASQSGWMGENQNSLRDGWLTSD